MASTGGFVVKWDVKRLLTAGIAVGAVVAATMASISVRDATAAARFCSLVPGSTLAVIRVEKDTTLPVGPSGAEPMSTSFGRSSPPDNMLAGAGTPMPAARVRVLQLDTMTRRIFASQGIGSAEPVAWIRAAPYGADCAPVRWTDTIPFAVPGEIGFVRATLAPRDAWVNGAPVLVIPDAWNYPYPRRRQLAFGVASDRALASADALFSVSAVLNHPVVLGLGGRPPDSTSRAKALGWARENSRSANLEPVRTLVRRAVLDPDWERVRSIPSRLRGAYRVDVEVDGERSAWFFRTHDRPGYAWNGDDSLQTSAQLIASPYVLGCRLVGYAASAREMLLTGTVAGGGSGPLVWLNATDRPTAPGNDARNVLPSVLEFRLAAAPEHSWDAFESFVPRISVLDSIFFARTRLPRPRADRQPRLPLTLRVERNGDIRGDTTYRVGGRAVRLTLVRLDTVSLSRPF